MCDSNKPVIDLNTCKKGQKLRNRRGEIVEYLGMRSDSSFGKLYSVGKSNSSSYVVFADGRGNRGMLPCDDHFNDIVEILPLEGEIPVLDKISTVDEMEFMMWDNVNEEYYGAVTSAFARKLEDNNHKLFEDNTNLLDRIKQLENANACHLAKIEQSRLEINGLITAGHKRDEVMALREAELRYADKAIKLYESRVDVLEEAVMNANKLKDGEQRLIDAGWYKETRHEAYMGLWVHPISGWHFNLETALTYL